MDIRIHFPSRPRPAWWKEVAEARLEHGRALDAKLPSWLIDSSVSRLGSTFATSAAMVWGWLLSEGRVDKRGRLWVFRGLPAWAFGRGGVCIGAVYLTGTKPVTDSVLEHEEVHLDQWRRFGLLLPLLYALAGRNPLFNRFEIEAGLELGGYVRPPRKAADES